jgi:hypothetical protein
LRLKARTVTFARLARCTKSPGGKGQNLISTDPLPSVNDIAAIVDENESNENAIFIAQTESSCLDNLTSEGDIPDDVSDNE